ncbi:flagellar biosynthetic protein FliO [Cupriavidus sp. D384]|uniref:flagellar biosynthetic protein FliO n=1 Tax=Cupriavidus sp. D384 TaxID=1538095 RepID=UPI0009ED82C4|nr:flagellar biosynthetic protein FliO [Cupriavidus sp. D384]
MTAASRRSAAAVRIASGMVLPGLAATGAQAADAAPGTAQAANPASSATASHSFAGNAPAISSGGSLAQAGLGLFAVIALILGMAWVARRVGLVRHGAGTASIKVVNSLALGTRQKVVTVEVGDTWLVLGVSPNEIRPLHTLPAQPDSGAPTGSSPTPPMQGGFGERLMRAMQENLKK